MTPWRRNGAYNYEENHNPISYILNPQRPSRDPQTSLCVSIRLDTPLPPPWLT